MGERVFRVKNINNSRKRGGGEGEGKTAFLGCLILVRHSFKLFYWFIYLDGKDGGLLSPKMGWNTSCKNWDVWEDGWWVIVKQGDKRRTRGKREIRRRVEIWKKSEGLGMGYRVQSTWSGWFELWDFSCQVGVIGGWGRKDMKGLFSVIVKLENCRRASAMMQRREGDGSGSVDRL